MLVGAIHDRYQYFWGKSVLPRVILTQSSLLIVNDRLQLQNPQGRNITLAEPCPTLRLLLCKYGASAICTYHAEYSKISSWTNNWGHILLSHIRDFWTTDDISHLCSRILYIFCHSCSRTIIDCRLLWTLLSRCGCSHPSNGCFRQFRRHV